MVGEATLTGMKMTGAGPRQGATLITEITRRQIGAITTTGEGTIPPLRPTPTHRMILIDTPNRLLIMKTIQIRLMCKTF